MRDQQHTYTFGVFESSTRILQHGMICSNYRPITLLNVAYKIFTILLNNRLSNIVESKLEDCQMGFQLNRSTIDNLFIVRQIIEKCYEFKIELHNIFIEYTKAFDSVYRDKIIKCLTTMKYQAN